MNKIINRIRVFFWLLGGFITKYYQFALISFVFGIISLFVFFQFRELLPQRKNIQKIGFVGRFKADEVPLDIKKKISRGLTKVSLDGRALPDLAADWEIKDDGKTYLFHLAEDISWHDNTPLIAPDVSYNFKDVQLEALDEKTLAVRLEEPFVPLPTLFSQPLLKQNYLGLGDYQVVDLKLANQYLLSLTLVNVHRQNELITYRFYPTLETALLGFKLGEIDILDDLSQEEEFSRWPNVKTAAKIDYQQVVALFFNLEDQSLSSKNLRQALAYGLENKKSDGERALSPLSPHSWAYNSQVKPYAFEPESAQTLYEKFKQEANLEGELTLELTTSVSQLNVAEEIKKSWEKLGITTQIRVVSEKPSEFQVFLASRQIPADPDQYLLWHSTQDNNLSHYNSPKVDKLLEDGRQEQDLEKRKEIYFDFQRFLVEDSPAIFLFHPKVFTIQRQALPYF